MNKIGLVCAAISALIGSSFASMEIENAKGPIVLFRGAQVETLQTVDSSGFGPGDKLVTPKGSAIQVNGNGWRIRINEGSELTNAGDTTRLGSGTIFVAGSGSDSLAAGALQLGDVVVRGGKSKFGVRMAENSAVSIAVINGSLNLFSANGTLVLEKGMKIRKTTGAPFEAPDSMNAKDWAALNRMAEEMDSLRAAPNAAPVKPDSNVVSKAAQIQTLPPAVLDTAKSFTKQQQTLETSPAKTDSVKPHQQKSTLPQKSASAPAPVVSNVAVEPPVTDSAEAPANAEEETGEKKEGIKWEIGLASVTIDGRQWQRISLSPDIPVWKFGICLDLEVFVDDSGNISSKGWKFGSGSDAFESLSRKIRYLRFARSGDPFYVKVGALDDVTLGYGLIVGGFANTFEYPEYKKLGLDFEVNGISPLELSLHGFVYNLQTISDGATIAGFRTAVRPLAPLQIPILRGLEIGVTAAGDENQYAGLRDADDDGVPDVADDYPQNDTLVASSGLINPTGLTPDEILAVAQDSLANAQAKTNQRIESFGRVDQMVVGGIDIGVPLITTQLLTVNVYGQYARNFDEVAASDTLKTEGWGLAAPGVAAVLGPLSGQAEFRHQSGRFQASYFNTAYERDRMVVVASLPTIKENALDSVSLNGYFASLKAKIGPVAQVGASYEHLIGENDSLTQKSLQCRASLGEAITKRIPKLASAAAYLSKAHIGQALVYDSTGAVTGRDEFFGRSPYMIFGYSVGFALTPNLVLTWDKRYAYRYDDNYRLVAEPKIYIQTAFRF